MSNKGFTLVELAIVLMIIGFIVGGAIRATSMIDNARSRRVVTQASTLIDAQNTYYERNARYAGDNNNDGQIDYNTLAAADLDNTGTVSSDADFAFQELKDQNLLPTLTNAELAKTQNGGQMHYAGILLADADGNSTPVNMVVITGETCITAYALELGIDGTTSDSANAASTGRVRQVVEGALAASGSWLTASEDCAASDKATTNIAFIF